MTDAPVRSLRSLADLLTPMTIRVAATLGLADLVGESGRTAAELAARTGTSCAALRGVLDHLVVAGVFSQDADSGRYRVTELGTALCTTDPGGLRDELDMEGWVGRAELAFVDLMHTVRTGTAAYPVRYGLDVWADLAELPRVRESFDARMSRRYAAMVVEVASRFDWSRFAEIVDVGGGDGTLLEQILFAHPGPRGQVVDLAPAAESATRRFKESGLADRAAATPGSFFEPLPTGADAYVLSEILHDWPDDKAADILSRCAEAAGPHGSVLIIEALREGQPGTGFSTVIDLAMQVFFNGRERTVADLTALARPVGLELHEVVPVARTRTLIEFRRAEPAR